MADVRGKVVIVTGGARGMGRSHCQTLAAAGAKVVVADVLDDEGGAVADAIGASFVHLDVVDEACWTAAVAAAEAAFGPVTALVNNAGLGYAVSFDDLTEREYRRFVDVNQVGVFLGMKAVVPSMRRRAGGGASIVNISSTAGLRAGPSSLAYVASKFAVTGMSKAAAVDLGAEGIRVNSVHPGAIEGTGMVESNRDYVGAIIAKTPMRRLGALSDVSSLVAYLVSDEAGYCTGGEFAVDGGVTCVH